MEHYRLDDYLAAYQAETDRAPTQRLFADILAAPDRMRQNMTRNAAAGLKPWCWFDLLMPKAVGWALAACVGLYIGLASAESYMPLSDEDYYLYGQSPFLFSEDNADEDIFAGDVK